MAKGKADKMKAKSVKKQTAPKKVDDLNEGFGLRFGLYEDRLYLSRIVYRIVYDTGIVYRFQ